MTENLHPVIDQQFLSGFLTEELFLLKQERNVNPEQDKALVGNGNAKQELGNVQSGNGNAQQELGNVQQDLKGNYSKKILILSNEVIIENTKEGVLLEKIIGAVNLGWKDILLIQSSQTFELERIEKEYAPRLIISFGKRNTILNWPQQFADGEVFNIGRTYYLSSQNLTDLLDNRQEKLLLWKNLKTLFKIE